MTHVIAVGSPARAECDILIKKVWFITDVTAVGSPARVECEKGKVVLNFERFLADSGHLFRSWSQL